MVQEKWVVGSEEYHRACQQEGDYWSQEVQLAVKAGIPFSVDMRRAERIFVDRGDGLPQQQIYDPKAERLMNGALYQYVFDKLDAHKSKSRVLVLTCGPGGLCLEIARHGHHVLGIDISQGAIEIAKRFTAENPFKDGFGSVEYQVADLNRLELPMGSFDAVVAWDGLHHILLLERLMQQIQKALVPGGLFIFSDNIGMHKLSRWIGGALYFLMPTTLSYRKKLRYALAGQEKVQEEMAERSPFEEISTNSIYDLALELFSILEQTSHTGIGYRAAIAGDMRAPSWIKYPFLKALKRMDDYAVRWHVLKGDHLLVVAQPKEGS